MASDHDLLDHYNNDKISDDQSTAKVGVKYSADEDFAVGSKKPEDHDDGHDDDDDCHGDDDDDGHGDDDDDGGHGDEDRVVKDVIMWRRRKISAVVLVVATGMWVMLQVYGFNFVPLASWTLMAVLALLFSHGLILRLLTKERPSMTRWEWEMTEQRAKEMGESTKRMIEKGIRWMFYVSCEREWYIFLGVISSLLLLAYVGHYLDLITLLYTGTMLGMTVPVIYVKKEDAIKSYVKRVRAQSIRMYHEFSDKALSKIHSLKRGKKEKKVE